MTELEQIRAMLDRIGVEYTEQPAEDHERWQREYRQAVAEWEQQHKMAYDNPEAIPWRKDLAFPTSHHKPGWVSLHPNIGYIDTEMVFDADGNLAHFWQNE